MEICYATCVYMVYLYLCIWHTYNILSNPSIVLIYIKSMIAYMENTLIYNKYHNKMLTILTITLLNTCNQSFSCSQQQNVSSFQ